MSGKDVTRGTRWMALWGWMDVAGVVFFLGSDIYRGRTPLIADLFNALSTHQLYGGILPLIVSGASMILFASFIASGYLLIKGADSGRYLAIAQSPFRVLLLMPSLFFLGHIKFLSQSLWILVAALVVTELVKLWSIRRSRDFG